jgi:DNA gyrase subunit A
MLISNGGTMIKVPVDDVKRLGRATQGVIVMRLRRDETVSALAPVVESEETTDENSDADEPELAPGELEIDGVEETEPEPEETD